MSRLFDVYLIEKEIDEAFLTRQDLHELQSLSKTEHMIPLEVEGNTSIAMGFIDHEAANSIDFIFTELKKFVAQILDGELQESENHAYRFAGLNVYVGYGNW